MKKRLLLFDIDGTLILMRQGRSRAIIGEVFRELFAVVPGPDEIGDLGGKTDIQILHEIGAAMHIPAKDISAREEQFRRSLERNLLCYSSTEHVDILPGVESLLAELGKREDVQLGLLTGNLKNCAYAKLKPYGLEDYFPFGAFGCDHHARNSLPPLAIRRANEFAGEEIFSPGNSLIIGDTPRDIECARVNGLPVLAVATGRIEFDELAGHSPDSILKDFSDTERTLQALLNEVWK